MQRYKIFGPPGTGKTSYLLSLLDKELQIYAPEDCAFVSFTKQGTYEGVNRAKAKYNFSDNQFPYFRTIHALCFRALGLHKADVINRKHYKQFSEAIGVNFTGFYTEDFNNENDKYLFACQLYQNNPLQYAQILMDLDYNKLKYVSVNYTRFKKAYGLIDFTDMLTMYLDIGEPLDVRVAFIDEAQDLTTLQWRVVYKMFSNAEKLYVAGDDDQSIYDWAGADVPRFLKPFKNTTILNKSYRLPESIHAYASKIIRNVKQRQQKQFYAREESGQVDFVTAYNYLDIPDDCLILARNKLFFKKIIDKLKSTGKVFTVQNKSSVDAKAIRAIQVYEQHRENVINNVDDSATTTLLNLYRAYFTDTQAGAPWFDVFTDKKQGEYYRKLIDNKADLSRATIALSTIHAAKGSEHKHVILLLDVTAKVYKHYITSYDSELRCYYVAVTRAKEKLTIKLPETQYGYPIFSESIKGAVGKL